MVAVTSMSVALKRYRSSVLRLFCLGVGASTLLVVGTLLYWPGIHTKAGIGAVGFLSLAFVFGPVAFYISRYRCPRCQQLWLSPNSHNTRQHGAFALWAFSHWQSCRACGLSADGSGANGDA
jgi:hypothetical protein